MTWIVYRIVKDSRCSNGERWIAIGWVNQNNEEQARFEAHKAFARYNEEQLKLMPTKPGYGFLV